MTFTDKVNCHELAGAFGQRSPVKVQAHMVCCSFVCAACLRLCFNGRRSGHLFEQLVSPLSLFFNGLVASLL